MLGEQVSLLLMNLGGGTLGDRGDWNLPYRRDNALPLQSPGDSFGSFQRFFTHRNCDISTMSIDDFCNSQANTEHHSMARLPTSSFAS
jgi:hypothetical protein